MKRLLACVALFGLLALVGCSGDSPDPAPVPTVTPDHWTLEMTVSPAQAYEGTDIVVYAGVKRNGSRPPDGTVVIFNPGILGAEFDATTTDGVASVVFAGLNDGFGTPYNPDETVNSAAIAIPAGTYTVSATVANNTTSVTFQVLPLTGRTESTTFEIYSVLPNQGSYEGGEQVTITGKNIYSPVEVTFDVVNAGAKVLFPAQVVAVQESSGLGGLGSVTIRTPEVTGLSLTEPGFADVLVTVRATFDDEQRATASDAFMYLADPVLQAIPPLLPNRGLFSGRQPVTINGRGIRAPARVTFIVENVEYQAAIVNVIPSSPLDGMGRIDILTPDLTPTYPDQDPFEVADVKVEVGVNTAEPLEQTLTGAFTFHVEVPDNLWLQIVPPLEPDYSDFTGSLDLTDDGEDNPTPVEVVISGYGIRQAVRVTFILQSTGDEYPAQVLSVEEGAPVGTLGTINVRLPDLSDEFPVPGRLFEVADVRVEVGVDGDHPASFTVPGAFTFKADETLGVPEWTLDTPPYVYLVVPGYGTSAGGQTVTILGRNFRAEYVDTDGVTVLTTAPAVQEVLFGTLPAQILAVSADGTQIQVMTPRFAVVPLEEDVLLDVTVTTGYPAPDIEGPFTTTITNAFLVQADRPTPEITAIAPIAGALDGGTVVTIFGHGFQFPVQVTFGGLAAEEVNLTDDQTVDDIDVITCKSPDYSQQNQVPPVTVPVTVRNVETGKVSNTLNYRYGDNLYVTGNAPSEGKAGDTVIIYGSGFEDPLIVEFNGVDPPLRLEVISVSGTELLVKFPENVDPVCEDASGTFTVTLIERNTGAALGTATGGSFTYIGNAPLVTNVLPRFIQTGNSGTWVDPAAITIYGRNFADEVYVDVGTGTGNRQRLDSSSVTVVSSEQIDIINLPAPNDFALEWDTTACITQLGEPGLRLVPTAVDVTVTNFPSDGPDECNDTLLGALVYEPEDTSCRVAANLVAVVDPVIFPDADAPSCTQAQMDVQNQGATTASILISELTVDGRFFLDAGFSQFVNPGVTVAAGQTWSRTLLFCPDVADGGIYVGTATITFSDTQTFAEQTLTVGLQGTELQGRNIQVEDLTGGVVVANGGTVTFAAPATQRTIRVTNSAAIGEGDLTITLPLDDPGAPYFVNAGGFDAVLSPGEFTSFTVTFNPVPPIPPYPVGQMTIVSDADTDANFLLQLAGP